MSNETRTEVGNLTEMIDRLKRELDSATGRLNRIRATCPHRWSEPIYEPIYQAAYTIPGDPPGTMGVDWRGPVYVPAKTTPQWVRQCQNCLLVEKTQRATDKVEKDSRFPTGPLMSIETMTAEQALDEVLSRALGIGADWKETLRFFNRHPQPEGWRLTESFTLGDLRRWSAPLLAKEVDNG